MEVEQKQELIDYFARQAAGLRGGALVGVVVQATSDPSLFAFSEILGFPSLAQLEGTEYAAYLDLLRLFAHGTCSCWVYPTSYLEVTGNSTRLPTLGPDQARKLKQLTVLTLAEANKILPYDQLMQELDVLNVRELEDFLIRECMYAGIVRGKLDQLRRCFQVPFAAVRDLRHWQLNGMIQTLSNWLCVSDNILVSILDKIKWADSMGEAAKKHQKELEGKIDEVKKQTWTPEAMMGSTLDLGVMDYEEERVRPKRRRHPAS